MDPFYEVKASVVQSLDRARTLASSLDAPSAVRDLRALLIATDADVQDLAESVAVVESNPARFGIDKSEVAARRAFVANARGAVKELQDRMAAHQTKLQVEQRSALLGSSARSAKVGATAAAGPSKTPGNKGNDQFIADETGRQLVMMQQQDQQLDAVLNTVSTLKEVAITMGDEIDDQVGLLHVMEEETDQTSSKLKGAMRRMEGILRANNDTKATWCIVVLSVVLVVLIFLVLV
ncbi:Syntaxin-6 [Allomyces arbusculus]|nr:Syntaxin-6 [Allomyces arbusculus]